MRTTPRGLRTRPGTRGSLTKAGSLTSARHSTRARWAWLLTLPLVAALIAGLWIVTTQPHPLNDYTLTGARSPACLRVIVIRDQSGSMRGYETARDAAMQALIQWSAKPDTLRPDDELAILDFGGTAAVALTTTTLQSLHATTSPPATVVDPSGSDINTAIALLPQLPATTCHTSLIVLSDGLIGPLTDDTRTRLSQHQVTNLTLILPDTTTVPAQWDTAFPYGTTLNAPANDSNQTSIAVAQAIASSTNQELQRH